MLTIEASPLRAGFFCWRRFAPAPRNYDFLRLQSSFTFFEMKSISPSAKFAPNLAAWQSLHAPLSYSGFLFLHILQTPCFINLPIVRYEFTR
jgi:hypothetical protein